MKEKRGAWERNDRFIAVATHAHTHRELRKLGELREHLVAEIESFFVHHAAMNDKKLRVTRRAGPKEAHRRLRSGVKAFRRER